MKTPVEVSAEQVPPFTAVMHQNARPVQPFHDRVGLGQPYLQQPATSYLAAAATLVRCFAKNASVFGQESLSASAR